ncbi:MAG TPA: beta-L-arabinofuranosidase domain-containing protein, partial [Armatimonadota bacterium]
MQTDSDAASQSMAPSSAPGAAPPPHRLTAVPIRQVTLDDPFWSPKLGLWREVTLSDCFTKFESDHGGAIGNFDLVRDHQAGRHAGTPWYDGLIYEMIRGAADFLVQQRSPSLEARIDGYIGGIVAAQAEDPDGYINTWTQSMLPQTQRWGMNDGDDRYQHDVYNAGMMIEAGVHYYRATGRPALLKAATRMADLMCKVIGPSPRANVVPGHSGPEEALVALYRLYR